MKKFFLLLISFFLFYLNPTKAEKINYKKTYEFIMQDGKIISYNFNPNGSGNEIIKKELILIAPQEGASHYDKRTKSTITRLTGGYYYGVVGKSTTAIRYKLQDDIVFVTFIGKSSPSVSAYIHEKSYENLSSYGGYDKLVGNQWKNDLPTNRHVKKYKELMLERIKEIIGTRDLNSTLLYKIEKNSYLLKPIKLLSFDEAVVEIDNFINNYVKSIKTEPNINHVIERLNLLDNENVKLLNDTRVKLENHFEKKLNQLKMCRIHKEFKDSIDLFINCFVESKNETPSCNFLNGYILELCEKNGNIDTWVVDSLQSYVHKQLPDIEKQRIVKQTQKYENLKLQLFKYLSEYYRIEQKNPSLEELNSEIAELINVDSRYTSSETQSNLISEVKLNYEIITYIPIAFKYIEEKIKLNNITPDIDEVFSILSESIVEGKDESINKLKTLITLLLPTIEVERQKKENECCQIMINEFHSELDEICEDLNFIPDNNVVNNLAERVIIRNKVYAPENSKQLLLFEADKKITPLKEKVNKYTNLIKSINDNLNYFYKVTTAFDVKIFGSQICIDVDYDNNRKAWEGFVNDNNLYSLGNTLAKYSPLHSFSIVDVKEILTGDNVKYVVTCKFNVSQKKGRNYVSYLVNLFLDSNYRILVKESFVDVTPNVVNNKYDTIDLLTSKIDSLNTQIISRINGLHKDILNDYGKYYKKNKQVDKNANLQLIIDNFRDVLFVQEKTLRFVDLRNIISQKENVILKANKQLPDVVKLYKKHISTILISWSPDCDNSKLESVIEMQNLTLKYIEKLNTINSLHYEIKKMSKKAPNVYKSYSKYLKSNIITWDPNVKHVLLDEVLRVSLLVKELLQSESVLKINDNLNNANDMDLLQLLE